ncbi:MAG: hypothetical protein AB1502_03555 [Thermodesulfobacteriota bacterium]
MKKEYDFSKGERGKFYRQNVRLHLPIYLDEESLEFVEKIAKRKKADLTSVVNEIIKGEKELAKTLT